MATHSLNDYFISIDEINIEKKDKCISIIQAMNYTLYGIKEKNLLKNECEIIGNFLRELSIVLTSEERQMLKKHLHLYGNSKVSWRSTKRLRIWSIIDLTARIYLLAIESKTDKNNKDYSVIDQCIQVIENTFVSMCNITDFISKIDECLFLINENSQNGTLLKKQASSLKNILRVNVNIDLDYFSCADIIGISLDYSNGDARILKLIDAFLSQVVKLNSIELAQQFASEMTQYARQSHALRHKGKKGLSTQDRT